MTVWDGLVGQQNLVHELRQAVKAQAPAHAWLFTGPPGSGRSNAAQAFAAALECEQPLPEKRGCGECASCHEVTSCVHPDVTYVNTDKVVISIAQVRRLVAKSQDAPSRKKWRILIVEDADRIQEKTANVLLKAIEEPPPRTLWMLCAPSPEDVPVTIRSRCRKAMLVVPDTAAIAQLLSAQEGVGFDEAFHAASLSQNHIGVARRLLRDRQTRDRREYIISLPLKLKGVGGAFHVAEKLLETATAENVSTEEERNGRERQQLMESLGQDPSGARRGHSQPAVKAELRRLEDSQKRRATRSKRDALDRYLVDIQSLYRDVLMTQLNAGCVSYVNGHLRERIQAMADSGDAADTLLKIDAIREARDSIGHNTDLLLTLEAMALKLL